MKVMLGIAIVAAVTTAAAAQSAQSMDKPAMGDEMKTTYTGCVEAVNQGAAFVLTHIGDEHDANMKDMKDSKGMKDTNDMKGEMSIGSDHMMPASVALTGSDLKKHVGQKVVVTGSLSSESTGTMREDAKTLKVTSLKVVAKSCS